MSFDLKSLLSKSDGEYKATLKGDEVTFHVRAPGHLGLIQSHRNSANYFAIADDLEEGDIYGPEAVEPHYPYMDSHIQRIEDQDWKELPEAMRMETLELLKPNDFWGLLKTINEAGSLGDDEKND